MDRIFRCQNGLVGVPRTFSYLLVPMAQHVLTKVIKENPPILATNFLEFGSKVGLTDVQTDVYKTSTSINSMTAFYDNKIITSYLKYGDFVVTVFTTDRDTSKAWQEDFEQQLIMRNQYRGKCLYAEGGNIEFREIPDTKWDDVILDNKVKKDIRLNTVSFLGDEKLSRTGVAKRGLVLFGPPGTGKTSIVKAIFRELEAKETSRIYVTAESFRRMSIGNLFDIMKYLGKTVLAFEDIDMVGTSRDVQLGSNLLGDLLTHLDGMKEHKEQLVVLASTNKISLLDDALANRPCRFDRKIEIGLPSDDNLRQIYYKLIGEDVHNDVIKLSKDFTGSHVTEAVNTSKILAASEDKVIRDCLIEACNIIRENFFPGQDTIQLKAAIQSHLIKKGYINKGFKKASSIKKTAAMIAEEIIAVTEIYQESPGGKVFKKTITEKYVNDGKPQIVVIKNT